MAQTDLKGLVAHEAKRIINRFYIPEDDNLVMGGYGEVPEAYFKSAKACAIVCVEEIIKVAPYIEMNPTNTPWECVEFWEYVKKDIIDNHVW